MEYEMDNPILNRARARIIHRNMNYILIIIGPTGIGKSWAGLRIAQYLDPNFKNNIKERVCFDILKMIKLINQKKIGRGDVLILDEAGIAFGTRAAMTIVNKQISYLLQAWRYLNCGLIMTLPDLTFLDVHGRKLCHAVFHVMSLHERKGYCSGKIYDNVNSPWKGVTLREFPCTKEGGQIIRHKWMTIGKPSKRVRKEYEEMKAEFNEELNKRIEDTIHSLEVERVMDMTKKIDNKRQARKMFRKGATTGEIAKDLDVKLDTVQKWVKDIRK